MPGRTRIDTDDLDDLEKTMGRWTKAVPKAADESLDKAASEIAKRASRAILGRPGGGSYHRETGAYSSRNVKGGGAVTIASGGTAIAAEWGARRGWVFGRVVSAASMSRRQFPTWRQTTDGTSGYVVGATIDKARDDITDEVIDGADEAMRRSARQSGTKTAGRYRGGF